MERRRSRVVVLSILGGLIGFAVLAGVVGAFLGWGQVGNQGSTTTSSSTTTTEAPAASLGPAGAELDELVAAGRTATYHATYGVVDPELPEGLQQSVEIWRKGATHFRSDIIEKASNGTRRQSNIDADGSRRRCETVAGTQTCQIVRELPRDLPAAFVRAILAEEPKVTLTQSNDDIAGFQARCFAAEGVGRLCLATDGVMLLLDLQGAVITAERVNDEVPEAAFDVSG